MPWRSASPSSSASSSPRSKKERDRDRDGGLLDLPLLGFGDPFGVGTAPGVVVSPQVLLALGCRLLILWAM